VLFGVLIASLENYGMRQGVTKKRAASPPDLIVFMRSGAGFRHPGDYVEGRTPKALALATACVRLWTPSLP
jgi:hypothetical protein